MNDKPRPNIRKKYIILSILVLLVGGGAWYTQRLLADRELHKGRSLLHDRDFDAAAGEFRRLVDSKKYHVKGRGLLLYSLVMEQKARRPLLAVTGVDADGLLRLVALNTLVNDEHVSGNQPFIKDLKARVKRSTDGVQDHLRKQKIDTRDWADTEKVLLSFSRAAWQNLDADTVRPTDPEARVLNFAAALISIKGDSRQRESRALDHVAARLADPNGSPDTAALIHTDAFDELLESTALSGRGLQAERARDILRRHRLYASLARLAPSGGTLLDPDKLNLVHEGFPDFKQTLFAQYPIFQQTGKPWEELAGWGFDPTVLFWEMNSSPTPDVLDVVWVYAAASQDVFQNYFLVFTDELKWAPLQFMVNGAARESLAVNGIPAAGFAYCPETSELVMNTPLVISDTAGNSVSTLADLWIPYVLNADNRTLGPAGIARSNACPGPATP